MKDTVKEFFKPELKKFIIPLIFFVIFVLLLNTFYSFGKFTDEITCEMSQNVIKVEEYRRNNDTESLQKMEAVFEGYNKNTDFNSIRETIQISYPFIKFLSIMDPFLPVPCELIADKNCRYYSSRQSYDCLTRMQEETGLNSIISVESKQYTKISVLNIIINSIILIIVGYIISSIMLFTLRKFIFLTSKK